MDGGAVAQVFLYPPSFAILERALAEGIQRERGLYVIRNSSDGPDWAQVDRRTMAIAARAVTSLIQSQGRGDLYRLYAIAQRDGVDFNLACIPERFDAPHSEEFDTGYMRRLFDFAYSMASNGYPWHKVPFDFVLGTGQRVRERHTREAQTSTGSRGPARAPVRARSFEPSDVRALGTADDTRRDRHRARERPRSCISRRRRAPVRRAVDRRTHGHRLRDSSLGPGRNSSSRRAASRTRCGYHGGGSARSGPRARRTACEATPSYPFPR